MYHFRVFSAAQKLPTDVALEGVTRKDEQERGIWVEQFQNSTLTLGANFQRGAMAKMVTKASNTAHSPHPTR